MRSLSERVMTQVLLRTYQDGALFKVATGSRGLSRNHRLDSTMAFWTIRAPDTSTIRPILAIQ